jgi:hypothetical protein
MKTSNKILWGSLGGLFATCVIFLVALRVLLGGDLEANQAPERHAAYVTREIAMVDFTGVELEGNWRAELTQGPGERITVEGPEDLLSTLSARRRGDALLLQMSKGRRDTRKLHLSVTMPALHSLRTKGVVDATFTGFDSRQLSIRAKGVTAVRGEQGRIGALRLSGKGVSKLDLRQVPTASAHLDCTGVIKIDLTMNGGELTGSIKGVGELRYAGETSRTTIRQEGPCKITREARV